MDALEGLSQTQGVLAVRNGESREYFEEQPANLCNVYAVAIVEVPLPPEPRSEKAEPFALVCAGIAGKEQRWGWLTVEKDTKALIAAELYDTVKAVPGRWYFVRLSFLPVAAGE